MKRTAVSIAIGGLCLILAGCGGGGGSGSGSSAAPTLNLNAAYASMLTNGDSVLYTLSGDCTGTSSQTKLPAYATTNFATPAVDVLAVQELQFDTLSAASQASSICTDIFNSQNNDVNTTFFSPTNQTLVNDGWTNYWRVYSEQASLPTTVTAGSSGVISKWKDYNGASSTAGTPAETGTLSYSVAADTATTLLVTITDAGTNTATGDSWSNATTYRLNANNTLSNLSFAIKAKLGANNISVAGAATAAPTLNAQAAQIALLTAGGPATYRVFDSNGTQCSPSATINLGGVSSAAGTTSWVSYAKSSTTTFNPQNGYTGSGNCSDFELPISEANYYDANYALIQQTTTNSGSRTSTNVNSSSVPWPTSVTIGNTGQLYTFSRYGGSATAFATGNVIYYVGALTPTTLALFEVTTKNYTNGDRTARNIFVNALNSDNTLAPYFGYIRDNGTYTLIP